MDVADKLAIHELLGRAAASLDAHEFGALSACFTDSVVFSIDIHGQGEVGPFEGREAVMGLINGSVEQQTDKRRHVISNIFFISEDEDTARVSSNLTLFATENGEVQRGDGDDRCQDSEVVGDISL